MCWSFIYPFSPNKLFNPISLCCPISRESAYQLESSSDGSYFWINKTCVLSGRLCNPFMCVKEDNLHPDWFGQRNWNPNRLVPNFFY